MLQRSAVERTEMKVDVTTGSVPLETTSPSEGYPNTRGPIKDAQHHRSQTVSSATLSNERKTSPLVALRYSADEAVYGTTDISLSDGLAIATATSAPVAVSDLGEKVSARGSAQSTSQTSCEQEIEENQVSDPGQTRTLPLILSASPSMQTKERVASPVQRVSSCEESVQGECGQTISKSVQFTAGTEEAHGGNDLMTRKTSLRLGSRDCDEEALQGGDRDRFGSLPRQGVTLQTSVGIDRQSSESDKETTLEWSEAERRDVDAHIATGLALLGSTSQNEEIASKQYVAGSKISLEHQIDIPNSIPPTRAVLAPIAKKTTNSTSMIGEGTRRSQGTESGQSQPDMDTLARPTERPRNTILPPSNATLPHDDDDRSHGLSSHESQRESTYDELSCVSHVQDFNTQNVDSSTGSFAVESLAVHSSGSAPMDENSPTLSPLLTRPPSSTQFKSVVGTLSISHSDAAGHSPLPVLVVADPSQVVETDNSIHKMGLSMDQSRVVAQQEVSVESDGTSSLDCHHQEKLADSPGSSYKNTYSFASNSRIEGRPLARVLPSDGAPLQRDPPITTTPGLIDHLVEMTSVSFNETSETFANGEEYDVEQREEAPPISPAHYDQSPICERPSPQLVLDQTVAKSELRVGYGHAEHHDDIATHKTELSSGGDDIKDCGTIAATIPEDSPRSPASAPLCHSTTATMNRNTEETAMSCQQKAPVLSLEFDAEDRTASTQPSSVIPIRDERDHPQRPPHRSSVQLNTSSEVTSEQRTYVSITRAASSSEASPSSFRDLASPSGSQESEMNLRASGSFAESSTIDHGSDAYEMDSRHARGRELSTTLELFSAGTISRTLVSDSPKAQLVSPCESAHDALADTPSVFSELETNHANPQHHSDASRLINEEERSQKVSHLSELSKSFQLPLGSGAGQELEGTTLPSDNRHSVKFRDNSNSTVSSTRLAESTEQFDLSKSNLADPPCSTTVRSALTITSDKAAVIPIPTTFIQHSMRVETDISPETSTPLGRLENNDRQSSYWSYDEVDDQQDISIARRNHIGAEEVHILRTSQPDQEFCYRMVIARERRAYIHPTSVSHIFQLNYAISSPFIEKRP
ncbi:hypothetical protein PAXRUDRAFT_590237 [Paxillus rubicundulus Ve08.2h10]|uniref:Uncharacterized protein n=1 Tax=Paxillus rubicundulus Ve08.2h10 TaxID=930991 RepID=A0A0D0DZ54_9AGAM|nr:hypothetical protein PAXRUDRAFT_590237 [Paxillus rubicundulus Ve08.2h10]